MSSNVLPFHPPEKKAEEALVCNFCKCTLKPEVNVLHNPENGVSICAPCLVKASKRLGDRE